MLTYPYLTRTLGPERLGAVHFVDYAVGLIWSLASIGIPAYGMYRIAQLQALGQPKRNVYGQMVRLHLLLSAIGFCIFYFLVKDHRDWDHIQAILPLGFVHILANSLTAEWYLQGKQRFDIPAFRNLALRSLGLLAIFWIVVEPSDFITYYWIIVASIVGSALINSIWIQVDLRQEPEEPATAAIEWKPLLLFFIGSVFISCTDYLDATVLGLLANETEVGYYSNAAKLIRLSLVVPVALNMVVSPQFSSDQAQGMDERIKIILDRSVDWILYLSVPISFLYLIYAEPLVIVFSGSSFLPSISLMKWMAALPIFISLSNLLIYYGLSGTDKKIKSRIVIGVLIGMITSIFLNAYLIPLFGALGTAVNSMMIEGGFALFFIWLIRPRIDWAGLIKTIVSCLSFVPIGWLLSNSGYDDLSKLLMGTIGSAILYLITQHYLWKHPFLPEFLKLYKGR